MHPFYIDNTKEHRTENEVCMYVLDILTTNFAAAIDVVTTGGKIFLRLCRSVTKLL
jgi:hypothetical protein